ncbi:MAG: hypothetical protein R2880_11090 [Deinococcales bacterium]
MLYQPSALDIVDIATPVTTTTDITQDASAEDSTQENDDLVSSKAALQISLRPIALY